MTPVQHWILSPSEGLLSGGVLAQLRLIAMPTSCAFPMSCFLHLHSVPSVRQHEGSTRWLGGSAWLSPTWLYILSPRCKTQPHIPHPAPLARGCCCSHNPIYKLAFPLRIIFLQIVQCCSGFGVLPQLPSPQKVTGRFRVPAAGSPETPVALRLLVWGGTGHWLLAAGGSQPTHHLSSRSLQAHRQFSRGFSLSSRARTAGPGRQKPG